MAMGLRLLVALVMVVSFVVGLGLVGLLCLLYLGYSFRPGSKRPGVPRGSPIGASLRQVLAAFLFLLSAVAALSGGRLSPFVFFAGGLLLLVYPLLSSATSAVAPVKGSVLFRSKSLPYRWHMVARVEPTQEEFPRALSSFAGNLVIFLEEGKAFAVASCSALTRRAAEGKLLEEMRTTASKLRTMAYLFPMDPHAAGCPFDLRFGATRLPKGDLAESTRGIEGVLVLLAEGGTVHAASVYSLRGPPGRKNIPSHGTRLESPPLLWEVLESVGKSVQWAEPDPQSTIIESLSASRREPLGESVGGIQGDGQTLTVTTLGGETHEISRAQFRAAVAIYR